MSSPSTPTTTTPAPQLAHHDDGVPRPRWRAKWVLAVSIGCYALFWWAGGRLGVSEFRGFNGSLLLSQGLLGNVLITAVLTLAAIVVGTLLAGAIRPDAGLFAAAAGLLALANHGGPIVTVLHDTSGARSTFLTLTIELILLYAVLGVGWWALFLVQRVGHLQPDAARDGLAEPDLKPAGEGWAALLSHVAIMTVVMMLLAQTQDKKQVLGAVGIGSFCGAFFPYWQRGAYPSVWYLAGPLVVGIAGYLLAYILLPAADLALGRPGLSGGLIAALGRPLPLDYASMGTIGALVGYWLRRKSNHERETLMAQSS